MRALTLSALLLLSCTPVAPAGDAGFDGGNSVDAGADGGPHVVDAGRPNDAGVEGLSLLTKLNGLWAGPATQTPVGTLPTMNVDFRALGSAYLFGRVDLQATESLRFGFTIETFNARDVLTYRNGGFFQGVLRDMRATLMESDEVAGTYRFCHVTQGCSYLNALFDFDADDRLVFDVKVRGMQHLLWSAQRKEARVLPGDFLGDLTSQGSGSAPFPEMPTLRATVTWGTPLAADTEVWLLLSTTTCGLTGSCTASRTFRVTATAGQSQAVLALEQLHAGEYKATAVLDRNQNLQTVLQPDTGDGISQLDTGLTIAAIGETTVTLPILVTVP